MYKWEKKAIEKQKFLFKNKFGSLKIIKKELLASDYKHSYLVECDCGNIFKTYDAKSIIAGKITSCPNCRQGSLGEEKVALLLRKYNIFFQKEKTFENCVFPDSKAKARFDFFIEKKYLIEFDGEQHFKEIDYFGGNYDFAKRKNHDEYKNQWCRENGIPLIRIPYWKLDTLCIEDLMLETTQFRVV